jgi:hypothetical protein
VSTLAPVTDRRDAFAKEDAAARQGLRAFKSAHMRAVSSSVNLAVLSCVVSCSPLSRSSETLQSCLC